MYRQAKLFDYKNIINVYLKFRKSVCIQMLSRQLKTHLFIISFNTSSALITKVQMFVFLSDNFAKQNFKKYLSVKFPRDNY